MSNERIEKSAVLQAPLDRVWRAVSDAAEFGSWFGMRADGPFQPGRRLQAAIVPTTVDDAIAEAQKPYEGVTFEIAVERMEEGRLFSFRWSHQTEPGEDPSAPPTTLVEFRLAEAEGGVRLTITESDFEQIPESRRKQVMEQNVGGWSGQLGLVAKYLALHP